MMVCPRPLPQMDGVRWGQGNSPLPVSILLLRGSPRIPLCAAATQLLKVDQGPSMSRHSSTWGNPAVFSSTKLTPDGREHTRHGRTGKPIYTDQRWKDLEERKPGQGRGRLTCAEGVIPCLEWSEREETFGHRPERGPGGSRAALGRTSQAAGTAHAKALRWVCAARAVAEAEEEGGTRGWCPWAGT